MNNLVHAPSPSRPETVADVLSAAADLIAPEGAWTQRVLARHRNGNPIGPHTPNAACWCSIGALDRSSGSYCDYVSALRALQKAVGKEDVAAWNDHPERTQAQVVAAFRKAAELARAEAP